MQRGARWLAALLALSAASCVDLDRPPELVQSLNGDGPNPQPTRLDGPASPLPQPTGLDGGPDAPEPDGPPPDAPASDGPADAAAAEVLPDASDAGPLARDTAPDTTPPDTAPPSPPDAGPLLVDDFSDSNPTANLLGGVVTSSHQLLGTAGGEVSFVWDGESAFHNFVESLRAGSCPRDISGYRTLRFRMRASVAGEAVQVFMGRATAACATATVLGIGTITPDTTMKAYTIDLGSRPRQDASFFEWSPPTSATLFYLDDIELLP